MVHRALIGGALAALAVSPATSGAAVVDILRAAAAVPGIGGLQQRYDAGRAAEESLRPLRAPGACGRALLLGRAAARRARESVEWLDHDPPRPDRGARALRLARGAAAALDLNACRGQTPRRIDPPPVPRPSLPVGADGPVSARRRNDAALAAQLQRISGGASIYVLDLTTGRRAGVAADRVRPAASTVKIGVMAAILRRYGARGSARFRHDVAAIGGWSSNAAAVRLVASLGGTAPIERAMYALGARRSAYAGTYAIGSAPALPRKRTTARDLGQMLATIHAAAIGDSSARSRSGLTRAAAGVLLDALLRSDRRGANRPLGAAALAGRPAAIKNGWLTGIRHTAVVLYTPAPRVVVVMTEGVSFAASDRIASRVHALVRRWP